MAQRNDLAKEMFEHVVRLRESGMGIVNYARQIGITRYKMQYWVRKIQGTGSRKRYQPEVYRSSFI